MTTGNSRRALAAAPLVILLAVVFFGLVAYKTYVQLDVIDQAARAKGVPPTDFFVKRTRGKAWTSSTILFLVPIAVAGGVGAAAYFMAGRRPAAAQIGMAVPLGLAVAAVGYQTINYLTSSGPPPTPTTPTIVAAPRPTAHTPAEPRSLVKPAPTAPTERPTPPPLPTPTGLPAAPAPHRTSFPSNPALHSRPSPPQPPAEDARIKPALDGLTAELDAQAGDLLAVAEPLMATLARPPRHDVVALDKRAADAAPVRDAAAALAKRLWEITDEAKKRLVDAGVPEPSVTGPAIQYSLDINSFKRSTAADNIAHLCDDAKEETQYLHQQFPQWRSDAKGEVISKDVIVQSHARGIRMQIEMTTKDKDRLAADLRGQ